MADPKPSSSDIRYQRYCAIVELAEQYSEFEASLIRESCTDVKPGFVTRVLTELEQDGWLVREAATEASQTSIRRYRWNSSRGPFQKQRWLDHRLFETQLKSTPEQARPRERLLAEGAQRLQLSELLAILIRSGRPGESAVTAGQSLARAFEQNLKNLPEAGRGELKNISCAVDKTAYCQIMAGIELGRRVAEKMEQQPDLQITSATQAVNWCRQKFSRLAIDGRQEEIHLVTLDTRHHVINTHQITVGTLNASLVHPREIFRPAIKDSASAVILVHNHPSGDPTPSREDHAVTKRMDSAGELLGITLLDHIVVASQGAVSIRQAAN